MTPSFNDPVARRRWDDYFTEVDSLLPRLGSGATELREDLRMHLADSWRERSDGGSEIVRLEAAIAKLGRPIDYLRLSVADELIDRGTRTYRPIVIARGLFHSVLAGSSRAGLAVLFGVGYLLIACFAAIAVLKPIWQEHVGLFRHADGKFSFGIVAESAGSRELLGWWSILVALAFVLLLYLVLTKGLRALHRR